MWGCCVGMLCGDAVCGCCVGMLCGDIVWLLEHFSSHESFLLHYVNHVFTVFHSSLQERERAQIILVHVNIMVPNSPESSFERFFPRNFLLPGK